MYHLLQKAYDQTKLEIIDVEEAIRILTENDDVKFSEKSVPVLALQKRLLELKAEFKRLEEDLN